jgi:hypothetical protein
MSSTATVIFAPFGRMGADLVDRLILPYIVPTDHLLYLELAIDSYPTCRPLLIGAHSLTENTSFPSIAADDPQSLATAFGALLRAWVVRPHSEVIPSPAAKHPLDTSVNPPKPSPANPPPICRLLQETSRIHILGYNPISAYLLVVVVVAVDVDVGTGTPFPTIVNIPSVGSHANIISCGDFDVVAGE